MRGLHGRLGNVVDMQRYHQKSRHDELPPKFRHALTLLLEAFEYAEQTKSDCWEFAVEMAELRAFGLTRTDFRWFVRQGLVEHQREVTIEGDNGRAFRPTGDLTFAHDSCFILTDDGALIASEVCQVGILDEAFCCSALKLRYEHQAGAHRSPTENRESPKTYPSVPKWNPETRMLSIDGTVVKRFKWTAVNQEAILAAFEEEGWPSRVDDPLPPQPEQDSKRRLSDTIKCLNRKQTNQLLHFRGDGTGEGVIWELVEQDGSNGNRV